MLERLSIPAELHYASLVEISRLIAAGEVSPVALTEAMLARIAEVDPNLNSFLQVTADRAIAVA